MKKFLYLFAAALMVAVACNKKNPDPTPQPDPTPATPDLELTTPSIVDVSAESSFYTVKFSAGKDWTATLSYPDGSESGAVLATEKGAAADAVDLRVTFQGLTKDVMGKLIQLDIKAGATTESILFFQGLVFFADNEEEVPTFPVAGGKFDLNILTNMDVTIKKYDGADEAFPWAPVTITEDKAAHKIALAFNVAANDGYDARTAYVKFTLPEVQVPVNDDEGNPTGETEDFVTRFYLAQEGYAKVDWAVSLKEPFSATSIETETEIHDATASVAFFDGKLLVSDSYKVFAFDPATGAPETISIPENLPVQSITNDDAGNLLLATLIPYLGVGSVYAVNATDTQMANPVRLIPWVNEAWSGSHGADKVAAKGDVFGNGVVTMMYGGVGSYGGLSYCLAWEIKDGAADVFDYNEWNKSTHRINNDAWFTTPELGDDLWLSNRAVFVPAGPSVADGFFYAGYDGLYNLYYYNGSEWNAIIEGVGDWDGSIMGMGSTEWNGKKILAGARLGYTFDWGPMPSSLWIIDVTDVDNPVVLSQSEIVGLEDQAISGWNNDSTSDVILKVEGNNLAAYLVDTSHGILVKKSYPKH